MIFAPNLRVPLLVEATEPINVKDYRPTNNLTHHNSYIVT